MKEDFMKKGLKSKKLTAVLLSIGLALSVSGCQTEAKKDDFFEAVNGALLSDWEIASDESYVSWISKMQDRTNEQMASVLQMAAWKKVSPLKKSSPKQLRALLASSADGFTASNISRKRRLRMYRRLLTKSLKPLTTGFLI